MELQLIMRQEFFNGWPSSVACPMPNVILAPIGITSEIMYWSVELTPDDCFDAKLLTSVAPTTEHDICESIYSR